ncbi:Cullin-domain-containing protein [Ramicandelaber brevisporus]|nr:Cullin-domain-containing protein [Ramicandelaber brevisporus]
MSTRANRPVQLQQQQQQQQLQSRVPAKFKVRLLPARTDDAAAASAANAQIEHMKQLWGKLQTALVAILDSDTAATTTSNSAHPPYAPSTEELFRICEYMCNAKYFSQLTTSFNKLVAQHVQNQFALLEQQQQQQQQQQQKGGDMVEERSMLAAVSDFWSSFVDKVSRMRTILAHLDGLHVIYTNYTESLWDVACKIFNAAYQEATVVRGMVLQEFLAIVEAERVGSNAASAPEAQHAVLKSIVLMYKALGIYETGLEHPIIEAADKFYQGETQRLIATLDGSVQTQSPYNNDSAQTVHLVNATKQRLDEERQRATAYLQPSTGDALARVVEQRLINEQLNVWTLPNGLYGLLRAIATEPLRDIYSLLERVGHLERLRLAFAEYIKYIGSDIVNNPNSSNAIKLDDQQRSVCNDPLVPSLIAFRTTLFNIVKECFNSDSQFTMTTKTNFAAFLNSDMSAVRCAESLAHYLDSALRTDSSSSSLPSSDVPATEVDTVSIKAALDNAMVLLRMIQSRDMFESIYKQDLAVRLLESTSKDIELDKSMIAQLSNECGTVFTKRIETMFRDMEVSAELRQKFVTEINSADIKVSKRLVKSATSRLHPTILTMNAWPNYAPYQLTLPQDMVDELELFDMFYSSKLTSGGGGGGGGSESDGNVSTAATASTSGRQLPRSRLSRQIRYEKDIRSQHSGRKLRWQHSLGNCTVGTTFASGYKELVASVPQTAVILQFNNAAQPSPSLAELRAATGLERDELIRILSTLTGGKNRILVQVDASNGGEVIETTRFTVNEGFVSPHVQVWLIGRESLTEEQLAAATATPDVQATASAASAGEQLPGASTSSSSASAAAAAALATSAAKSLFTLEHVLDAAVIRIVKSHKRISHTNLLREIYEQPLCRVDPGLIKQRIESLIGRDFIGRANDDSSVYIYLA